jgi:DNA-nicking Smr family endonuclease
MDNFRTRNGPATGPRKHRLPSQTETELWRRAVADVEPLVRVEDKPSAGSPVLATQDIPSAAPPNEGLAVDRPRRLAASSPAKIRSPESAPSDLVHGIASGIDKRTLGRLRRGLIAPEACLDLHNLRQDEAHRSLTGLLATSQAAGRRCILVITGKGYGADGAVGVLKTMVPRWLLEPPNRGRVLAFCHAARGHGGEGALYVLLRRSRVEPGT